MPIPMIPKMEHTVGREGAQADVPLRLALVSTGRLLLHFLSIGT